VRQALNYETWALNSLKQPQLVKTFQKKSEPLRKMGFAGLLVAFVTLTNEILSVKYPF
jgi:hypothetical protein